MAKICVECFSKSSANLIFLRFLKQKFYVQILNKFSTSKCFLKSITESYPVKFTTSKACKMSVLETTGMLDNKRQDNHLTFHVILGSTVVLLIYFCILREENDIDELIKGNNKNESDAVKLLKLKLQLSYCQNNHLPTEPLRQKISELEKNIEKKN